jgi:hypothetical protein
MPLGTIGTSLIYDLWLAQAKPNYSTPQPGSLARWPESAAWLPIELRRIAPQLRIHGIIIKVSRCNQSDLSHAIEPSPIKMSTRVTPLQTRRWVVSQSKMSTRASLMPPGPCRHVDILGPKRVCVCALRRRSGVSRRRELTAVRIPHQFGDRELSAPKATERLRTLDRWRPFAVVSSFTFDHTKPRFGHLHPIRTTQFDGDVGFPIIYGKRPTFYIDDFVRDMSGRVRTVTGEGRLVLRPPVEGGLSSTRDFTPKHQIDETGLPQPERGQTPGDGARPWCSATSLEKVAERSEKRQCEVNSET